MSTVTTLGIDLAKRVFQLHGVDSIGKCILKKRLKRHQLALFLSNMPECTVVMEACSGSSFWAKKFIKMGHEVKLISPQFVKPFVKTNKNDANDAEAIVEAASRPSMRFVDIKEDWQQDIQIQHRVRERLVKARTALSNEIRGFLTEFGIVLDPTVSKLKKAIPEILGDAENDLSMTTRDVLSRLFSELLKLEEEIKFYEEKLKTISKMDERIKKVETIPGIGFLTATALIAAMGDPNNFKNGRHFSAWLGLVPRQNSSGNKSRLLGISKRGNKYLRKLMVHGSRSVLIHSSKVETKRSLWIEKKKESLGWNKTSVAVANKNARIAWAILKNDTEFKAA